jgi:ABC transporter, ATP-binding protein
MGIITNNLTIGYQNPVLNDVNLSVNKGEILCVLGKNGSGKTTLFKTLLGLLPKLSGEILLDDQPFDFSKKQENAKKIAYIPQARKIDFSFTAFEVVLFGRTPHLSYFGFPSKKDKEIATETMAQIGILSLKDKVFSQMSGGEQQLTIIARALTQEPEYIVMDEPTSALDFGNQIKVIQQIKSLQNKHIGIVLSTHNPDHVFLCNSKVAVVKDGRLAVTGTPEEVMSETLLKSLYDIDMKIIDIEGRKVCFPYTFNH